MQNIEELRKESPKRILKDETKNLDLSQKGFTEIRNLLSPEEVNYLLDELIKLSPNDKYNPIEDGQFGVTFHTTFLDTNIEYKRQAQSLITKVFLPHFQDLLTGYEILTCNFHIKPSGKGEIVPHQNWSFLEAIDEKTLTIWCPLVDVNENNGALRIVDGSHNLVQNIIAPTIAPYFLNINNLLLTEQSQLLSMNSGDGVIFDDNIVHWSSNNNSSSPRYAVQLVCKPTNYRTVIYYCDYGNDTNNFEIFEINSDFFIENTLTNILTRPDNLKSLGFVKNKNSLLSEEEFLVLLNQRTNNEHSDISSEVVDSTVKYGFYSRLKSFLGKNIRRLGFSSKQ